MASVVLAVTDPNILYLLQRYAEESGLEAVVAGRGDLLEAVRQARPVLVIAEEEAATLAALRESPETGRIPLLIYSGDGRHPGAGARPGGGAATGYLQEYVMYDQFLAALRRVGVRLPEARVPRVKEAQP